MLFEWDADKRDINGIRHRLDLVDAQLLFDGRPVVTMPSPRDGESRFVSTGQIGRKFYSVVRTERREVIRLISFRRARDAEERAFNARFG
jgi:uncharacterized DUF497 family protein